MKKTVYIITFGLLGGMLSAQNLTDGLRYSMEDIGETF